MKNENAKSASALEALNAEFQLLRAHVENGVEGPAVIIVTSAEQGDGKSLIAHTLAECLARSGRRTALLDATQEEPGRVASEQILEGGTSRIDVPVAIALPDAEAGLSREDVRGFFDAVRSEFEFTIVDTNTMLSSHRAMMLAGLADGILLPVRLGRAPTENDRMLVRVIEQSRGNILGVVATKQEAIARFETLRAPIQALASENERAALAPGVESDVLEPVAPPKRTPNRLVIARVAALAAVCLSLLGIAAAPQPAKDFVHHLVAELTHGQI